MGRVVLLVCLFLFGGLVRGSDSLETFLSNHCNQCHGPDKEKGDLRIDLLSRDFQSGADSHLWAEVMERINAGEMPPEDEPQPSENEISSVIAILDQKISQGKAARLAARPPIAHYRLSRQEYRNTIYDLLGVHYDPTLPGGLNADSLWHGFERIGSQLSLSPSHMERYFKAANQIVDRAFPEKPIVQRKIRKTAAELRYGGGAKQQEFLDRFGIERPLRSLMFNGRLEPAFYHYWFGNIGPESSGLYRARMQVSGVRPKNGQIPHLRIGKKLGEVSNEGLIELDVLAPEDEPKVVEFETYLAMPTSLHFNVVAQEGIDRRKGAAYRNHLGTQNYIFTHSSETQLLYPTAPAMFDGEGNALYPMVLLDWIEWEGPIVTEAELAKQTGILPTEESTLETATEQLQAFTQKAWRRPVSADELAPYIAVYEQELNLGETTQSAFKAALLGVLTSRNFTYLIEGNIEPRAKLTDYELASRLSYFLWSSMPDADLFQSAEQGDLTSGKLEEVIDRMMTDEKIDRFINDFPRQWLQLHQLGQFPPDKKIYPGYDTWLEESMRKEVELYFREMFTTNQPINQFIDSDWTYANQRLSNFYNLPISTESGFQRVNLPAESNRGGLLTMGAILGMTSDGTRHRPVHRGVWLSETIFAKTPPPPPANVDPIEPNPPESPKATIRQKLKAHTEHASCAACHKSIDPLGLAFDQFDAIGQWRTHEIVATGTGENPPSDASGELPDGRTFADAKEFKQLLLEDRDKFLRAFVEQLSTYALRRVLTVDDQDDIDAIVLVAKQNHYQLKEIVKAVAISDLLKKR